MRCRILAGCSGGLAECAASQVWREQHSSTSPKRVSVGSSGSMRAMSEDRDRGSSMSSGTDDGGDIVGCGGRTDGEEGLWEDHRHDTVRSVPKQTNCQVVQDGRLGDVRWKDGDRVGHVDAVAFGIRDKGQGHRSASRQLCQTITAEVGLLQGGHRSSSLSKGGIQSRVVRGKVVPLGRVSIEGGEERVHVVVLARRAIDNRAQEQSDATEKCEAHFRATQQRSAKGRARGARGALR